MSLGFALGVEPVFLVGEDSGLGEGCSVLMRFWGVGEGLGGVRGELLSTSSRLMFLELLLRVLSSALSGDDAAIAMV